MLHTLRTSHCALEHSLNTGWCCAVLCCYVVQHGDETLKRMYQTMVNLNVLDQIFYDAQRQGRISFYMTNFGSLTHTCFFAVLRALHSLLCSALITLLLGCTVVLRTLFAAPFVRTASQLT